LRAFSEWPAILFVSFAVLQPLCNLYVAVQDARFLVDGKIRLRPATFRQMLSKYELGISHFVIESNEISQIPLLPQSLELVGNHVLVPLNPSGLPVFGAS